MSGWLIARASSSCSGPRHAEEIRPASGDEGGLGIDRGEYARTEVSMAKIHVANVLHHQRPSDPDQWRPRLFQGYGARMDLPLCPEARLVDGADEVHKMVINREMAGKGRDFWAWRVDGAAMTWTDPHLQRREANFQPLNPVASGAGKRSSSRTHCWPLAPPQLDLCPVQHDSPSALGDLLKRAGIGPGTWSRSSPAIGRDAGRHFALPALGAVLNPSKPDWMPRRSATFCPIRGPSAPGG